MLIIWSRLVNEKSQARTPNHPLHSHLSTHHSNVVVSLVKMTMKGCHCCDKFLPPLQDLHNNIIQPLTTAPL